MNSSLSTSKVNHDHKERRVKYAMHDWRYRTQVISIICLKIVSINTLRLCMKIKPKIGTEGTLPLILCLIASNKLSFFDTQHKVAIRTKQR